MSEMRDGKSMNLFGPSEADLTERLRIIHESQPVYTYTVFDCPSCRRGEPCAANAKLENEKMIEQYRSLIECLDEGDVESIRTWLESAIRLMEEG